MRLAYKYRIIINKVLKRYICIHIFFLSIYMGVCMYVYKETLIRMTPNFNGILLKKGECK